MIVGNENMTVLLTQVKEQFKLGMGEADPTWEKVATKVPSSGRINQYAWLGQFPRLRQWLGSKAYTALRAHGYSVENVDYEASVEIPRNDILDDLYGTYSPLFKEMGYASRMHPDEIIWELLQGAFTELCYDELAFFATNHPVGNGTYSNLQTGVGTNPWFLLDTRRPLKPLFYQERQAAEPKANVDPMSERVWDHKSYAYSVEARGAGGYGFWQLAYASEGTLNQTNFDSAYASMMAVQSDEGRPIGAKPTVLICGPSNRSAALQCIEVERLANGASNPDYKAVNLMIVPWLP